MTIKELQALSTVADMLIELAQDTKIPFDETEQKLSDLEREDYRPPCDFCEKFDNNKKILKYEGRETKYCPFCGRKFVSAENNP